MACFCTGACHQLGYCPFTVDTAPVFHGVWISDSACTVGWPAPREGWICPRCERSNSPDAVSCSGCGPLLSFNVTWPQISTADGEAVPLEITDDMVRAAMRADTEHRHAGLEERLRAVLEAALGAMP